MSLLAATFIQGMAYVCGGCVAVLIILLACHLGAQSRVGKEMDDEIGGEY